ncbi:MAG TPA: PhoH family protein [Saprospiraceae bacterium]|nr:PhoH family protein [Saprospiraceae bacterium]
MIESQNNNLTEININLEGIDPLIIFGENDIKIKLIKKSFPNVNITSRGMTLKIVGSEEEVAMTEGFFKNVLSTIQKHGNVTIQELEDHLMGNDPSVVKIANADNKHVIVYSKDGKPIKAKTHNQKKMVDMSRSNDILFAIGPAGTGKTYTAVALAVAALKTKLVKKIILTRPAVEAGESLGFLPGDLKDKIDPYLRPLYDALDDLFPGDKLKFFMENRVIEVAPLAYMRGRTLDNAYIILDEAQNCTASQIKMFLTRLGPNAKCIITGDLTQVDLPYNQKSGLKGALDILGNINGIAQVFLSEEDVVRHRLVKEIIKRYNLIEEKEREAYERHKKEKQEQRMAEQQVKLESKEKES